MLRVWDEAAGAAVAEGGVLVSNPREGRDGGPYLSASDSPSGASTQTARVAGSAAQSSFGLRFLYTARPWSPVGEVYHYRARWYAPDCARFLTRDPIGYAAGPTQYGYVGGNPINRIDPTGLIELLGWGNGVADDIDEGIDEAEQAMMGKPSNWVWNGMVMTAADQWRTYTDLLRFGTGAAEGYEGFSSSTGEELSDSDRLESIAQDVGRGSSLMLMMAAPLSGAGKGTPKPPTEGGPPASSYLGKPGWEPTNLTRNNSPANIGGRNYTGHALDRMQMRGLFPSRVENTIRTGARSPGRKPGTTAYYDSTSNTTVIVDTPSGRVITVHKGSP